MMKKKNTDAEIQEIITQCRLVPKLVEKIGQLEICINKLELKEKQNDCNHSFVVGPTGCRQNMYFTETCMYCGKKRFRYWPKITKEEREAYRILGLVKWDEPLGDEK